MTKRLSSKLLSVILTLAICATTVFGCLMTVSAETSWVNFSAGETTNEELTEATIKLTVTLPDSAEGFTATQDGITYGGIVAGSVALDCGSDITFKGVKVDGGTKIVDGYQFYADEFVVTPVTEDNKIVKFLFEASNTDNNIYYSQLTFELSFTLTGAENGENFSVTASSVVIGGAYDGVETSTAVTGTIVAGCDHKLVGVGDPIQIDTVNGYAVYSDSECTGKCKAKFGPQVVPTKLPGTISVLEFIGEDDGTGARFYDSKLDDEDHDYSTQDGTKENPIIIDSARELSYLTQYINGADTKGKYYKVADGISGFDMSLGNIDFDGTIAENLATIDRWGNHNAGIANAFQGHFDGNGATVYGLRNRDVDAAGLFPYAMGNVEIKNVNVSLSYLKAKYHAGGIVGVYNHDVVGDYSTYANNNKLIIDCCSVTDCYIETTEYNAHAYIKDNNGQDENIVVATGAIYGGARNATKDASGNWYNGAVNVSNCFIDLDEEYFISVAETKAVQGIHGGIGGCAVTNSTVSSIKDCVVIGIAPYSVSNVGVADNNHQHTFFKAYFSDIYTTAPITAVSGGTSETYQKEDYTGRMYQLTTDQMKGEAAATNMPNLDWNVWEIDVNRGYPKFKQAENPDVVSNTSDYGLTLIGTNITYNDGGDYNYNFYYRPNTTDAGNNYPDLYVAQLNEAGTALGSFHRLEGEVLTSSPVDGVQVDDIRYTIKRLSAREIYNTLLATAVVVKDGEVLWGDTEEFSIAKYEQAIIDGNYDTADKNLAEAVLKYGRASEAALNTKNDAASGKTIHWDGTTAESLDTFEQKDGVYIINEASELAYIVTAAYDVTQGKTFKVADGISNIVLQKKEHDNGIMQLSSQSEVEAYFEDAANSKTWWVNNYDYNNQRASAFYGTFDGNGATVYGLYGSSGNQSLFGAVMATAVIKNLTVKNCYLSGSNHGAVVSANVTPIADTTEEKNTNKYITFENIEISNCRMEVTNVGNKNVGLLTGTHQSGANVTVNNLLVYGCEIYCTADSQVYTRLSGQTGWNNAATGIKNSVILDCSITEPLNSTLSDGRQIYNYVNSGHTVENVYSSCADDAIRAAIFSKKITYITNEQAMGVAAVTNMPNLDWNGTWCYSSTYPSLAKGAYTSASSGKTLYWNGKAADKFYADTDGASADDPIIIDTAEELAYVATATYADTNGKYFKIADGIDKIVLQSETYGKDIVSLDSAEAVKDYFEPIIASDMSNNKATLHGWASYTWDPSYYCFSGNLDGNGVEIYGMYHSTTDINSTITNRSLHGGASGGGLFSVADNATISNLAIKNSYAKLGTQGNTHTNYSFGLIVSFGKNMNSTNNAIVIDHCTVANNYIEKKVGDSSMSRAGVVCGLQEAGAFILQNCLVYGNSATGHLTTADQDYKLGIVGGFSGGTDNVNVIATDEYKAAHPNWIVDNKYMATVLENSVVLGTPLLATDTAGTTIKYSQWLSLNAINSSNENYKNVYTDWDIENLTNADSGNFIKSYFLENCGEVVTESDLIGNTAKANEIVGIFNADNKANSNDTVWYTGNSALLGFNPPTEMIGSAQEAYDAITFTSADSDVYNEDNKTFGVYATSLNLKTNPYISFAFAFSGEYKSNRDKIKVTFNYYGGSKEVSVADESGALLDGWSNASNDRFHIYRFQDIPVEALSSPIEVTVTYNDTETVTGSFSVKGFGFELINAYKKAPSNYYATRIEAVKALLFYTQMLQARYGA